MQITTVKKCYIKYINIHNSESRDQEETGHTQHLHIAPL